MRGLFIGRFQPFHLGHLDALKRIVSECDEIVIAIGSKQYSNTGYNPYPFELRKEMIERIIAYEGIDAEIIGIEDINDNEMWVEHVKKHCDFDIVYSSNELVVKLFEEKFITVKRLVFNINISATEIRDMRAKGDDSWKDYVSSCIWDLLD